MPRRPRCGIVTDLRRSAMPEWRILTGLPSTPVENRGYERKSAALVTKRGALR